MVGQYCNIVTYNNVYIIVVTNICVVKLSKSHHSTEISVHPQNVMSIHKM